MYFVYFLGGSSSLEELFSSFGIFELAMLIIGLFLMGIGYDNIKKNVIR